MKNLLAAAGMLMMTAGLLFVCLQLWHYAALLWVGAFGCLMAALNFRSR